MTDRLSRSRAAVEELERLQAQQSYLSGVTRDPAGDPRVLREIAERQLLAERLDAGDFRSVDEMTAAVVELVGEPSFQSAAEARARELEHYDLGSDGDIWSRYERPDHRRRLADLVVRVEQAASSRGYRIPRRPVVGTLPTFDINAQARPGPPGEGHLVVFETGIFTFSNLLAKVAGQALDARISADTSLPVALAPAAIGSRIVRHPGIVVQFVDLLFSQAVLGTCAFAGVYQVAREHMPFVDRLTEVIQTFLLAHEYGHVILGHTDVHRAREATASRPGHADEFNADRVALDICAQAWGGLLWAYAGASLFLSGVDVVTRASAVFLTGKPEVERSPSHPTPGERRAALWAVLQRVAGRDVNERSSRLADTMHGALGRLGELTLPAFARAHQQGYPEPGFRPRNEYEKRAALYAFIHEGLGPGFSGDAPAAGQPPPER